jgi:hypothetical protein
MVRYAATHKRITAMKKFTVLYSLVTLSLMLAPLFATNAQKKYSVEIGNKVAIRFKTPDATITGTILSLSDSLLILSTSQEPYRQVIPFWNIKTMNAVARAKKRYIAKVRLMNGMRLTGLVIRIAKDSVTILNNRGAQPIRMGATEIESIKIRGKGSIGRRLGIGAGTGFILGGIIGYGSYTREYTCRGCGIFDDIFQAEITVFSAVAGGGAGLFVGAIIGAALEKDFIINGSQARFDLFANEFRKIIPSP